MSAKCPTCGQPVAKIVFEPDHLLALMDEDRRREPYLGQDGRWHLTYSGGEVTKAAIDALVARGILRPKFKGGDGFYTRDRTIDVEATRVARKATGKRTTIVYADGLP